MENHLISSRKGQFLKRNARVHEVILKGRRLNLNQLLKESFVENENS